MKAQALAALWLTISLTGCAVYQKPQTQPFSLPSSCLGVVPDVPVPREDIEEYISELIADRTDLAVQHTLCRSALIELSRSTAASAK